MLRSMIYCPVFLLLVFSGSSSVVRIYFGIVYYFTFFHNFNFLSNINLFMFFWFAIFC